MRDLQCLPPLPASASFLNLLRTADSWQMAVGLNQLENARRNNDGAGNDGPDDIGGRQTTDDNVGWWRRRQTTDDGVGWWHQRRTSAARGPSRIRAALAARIRE